jgi:hypothetical protein
VRNSTPIEPYLITAYQARLVTLSADFLVALLAAGAARQRSGGVR